METEPTRTPSVAYRLNRALSQKVSRIKGSEYDIDERVGLGYLTQLVATRAAMKARGALAFPGHRGQPFFAPTATVRQRQQLQLGTGVTLGPGSYVDALSVDGVRLGDNTSVGRGTRIECTGNIQSVGRGMTVGDNVGLGTDCFYGAAGGIEIGSETIIGNFVSMHSENHVITDPDSPIRTQGVTREGIVVGRDCWIGAKATILDGARIGDGCVIAAGAVVAAGEYPAGGILGGVPAREIARRDP